MKNLSYQKSKWLQKGLVVLFAFTFFYHLNYGQQLNNQEKIDPIFRELIKAGRLKNAGIRGRTADKVEKNMAEAKATTNQQLRKYDCIVYTKDVKVLKDNKILINSTFPNFVTALVTLKQIELMASMREVTYIEAPKTLYPTQRNSSSISSKQDRTN